MSVILDAVFSLPIFETFIGDERLHLSLPFSEQVSERSFDLFGIPRVEMLATDTAFL